MTPDLCRSLTQIKSIFHLRCPKHTECAYLLCETYMACCITAAQESRLLCSYCSWITCQVLTPVLTVCFYSFKQRYNYCHWILVTQSSPLSFFFSPSVSVCRNSLLLLYTCIFVPLQMLSKHSPQLSVSLMKCNVILCRSCSSGSLIQLPSVERGKLSKVRLGSLSLKKEGERQCFLFTKHFLVCTRSSGGKLHLLKVRTPSPQ